MKKLWNKWKMLTEKPAAAWIIGLLSCILLPYLFAGMIEFIRIRSVTALCGYLGAHWDNILYASVVFSLLYAVIMLATARPWIAALTVGGLLTLAGWTNLQKMIYRGDPVVPRDIFQAKDALSISGELHITLGRETALTLLLLLVSVLLLLPVRLPFGQGSRSVIARCLLPVLAAASVPLYMEHTFYDRSWLKKEELAFSIISLADGAYRNSFTANFLMLTDNLFRADPPEGYSAAATEQAIGTVTYEQPADQRSCDVIVVLLESYFELFNYDTAVIEQPINANFRRIADEGVSGQMLSEFYCGGTANVEFGVLTGYEYHQLPAGCMPYIEFVKSDFLCYPQYLKAQGWQTEALHPYKRQFYSRSDAYEDMGFDTFLTEEAFDEGDILGNYIGEQATFDKALELCSEADPDTPLFLHIVTMQNHIPNQPDEYAPEHQVKAYIEGESDWYNGCLTSVATTLRDVDAAVGSFVDALRTSDRDTVVLFFGDHQTIINGDTGEDLLTHMAAYNALPADEQTLAGHVTPFLMWANFDVREQGKVLELQPSSMLLPMLLHEYDIRRPDWMEWLYAWQQEMQPLTYPLCFGDTEALAEQMTPRQRELYEARNMLQYDLMFGKQYAAETLYGGISGK